MIKKALKMGTACILAALTLSSCYIPDKFKSELILSKEGKYHITFEGDVIYLFILKDYKDGKITKENEQDKIKNIYKDLVRDPAICPVIRDEQGKPKKDPKTDAWIRDNAACERNLTNLGQGRFRIKYDLEGFIFDGDLITLFRRDAKLLLMKSNDDGTIGIGGNSLRPADASQLVASGINMKGEFRITTDSKEVLRHNATEVYDLKGTRVYLWKIDGPLSPPPQFIMKRVPLDLGPDEKVVKPK